MADNKQIKDGLGNLFNVRMRDRRTEADGVLMQSIVMSSLYPVDYGTGGMFQHTGRSGVMAAGLAVNSPIYAFRWSLDTLLGIVRHVRINAWALSTFTAGIGKFELYAARSFIAQDTGGQAADLSVHNAKLRTSMQTSQAGIQYSSTATLAKATAESRELDTNPIASVVVNITTAAPDMIADDRVLLETKPSAHPLFLADNEGFVIQASMPAGGTWGFTVTTEWDEVEVY
jgi:hypothetical protein